MATSTPHEVESAQSPARSGKETLEYKKVLVNLEGIVEALKANKGAKESLCLKCTMKEWNELTAELSEGDVIKLILTRIKMKAETYYEFMTMLANIDGLDVVKETIETTICKCIIIQAVLSWYIT